MTSLPVTFASDVVGASAHEQFEAFIDEHRNALDGCLDGLTEEQARLSLVPSRTTLLGLVKHVTFVEKVWFDEAVTCRSRAEIGLPESSEDSFLLDGSAIWSPRGDVYTRTGAEPGALARADIG
ncbi:mycothiol transferase [Micromonospora profundi]